MAASAFKLKEKKGEWEAGDQKIPDYTQDIRNMAPRLLSPTSPTSGRNDEVRIVTYEVGSGQLLWAIATRRPA
jgi:hypothetical protein